MLPYLLCSPQRLEFIFLNGRFGILLVQFYSHLDTFTLRYCRYAILRTSFVKTFKTLHLRY